MDNTLNKKVMEYRADTRHFRNRLIWGLIGLVLSLLGFFFVNSTQMVFNLLSMIVFVMASWVIASAVFAGTSKVVISDTQVVFESFLYHWATPWERVRRLEMVNTLDPDRMKREYATFKLWGDNKKLLGQIDLMAFQDTVAEKIASQLRSKAVSAEIPTERT